ncbi:MAG: DUF1549 and DUF1553 domain-containing protein [Fuerstiella sp.]
MLSLLSIALLINESAATPVDFDTQVVPILTKAGCNTGACHGAAAGRGGFHLSLYGSRPDRDYEAIALALEGRRLNRRDSEVSLFLQKPTEELNHEGGTRIDLDGSDYQTLKRWIGQGAPRLGQRKLTGFRIVASTRVVHDLQQSVQLSALASFDHGSEQDVSAWTVFKPEDASSVTVDDTGLTKINRRGRHIIVTRFLDRVEAVELIAPMENGTAVAHDKATHGSVDAFVEQKLFQIGLHTAHAADDSTFVRRLFVDLTGRLPSPADAVAYGTDMSIDKKERLVDRLLASAEFTDFWTFRLAKRLRVAGTRNKAKAMRAYYDWVHAAVAQGVPFDQMARQLLLGEGAVQENGPANFYAVTADARTQAEFVSRVFLGIRLQCANCHDHPLDSWTQDDYHGLSAIFARVKRGEIIRVTQSGEVIHPGTGEPALPRIPGQRFLSVSQQSTSESSGTERIEGDHRTLLTEWIVAPQNPYFARSTVNRVWSHLMGRGLVEPVNDHRATNPATHPELLDWLTQDFIDNGMHLRHTIRQICLSDAYARSSTDNQSMPEFYATAIPKPLAAEVFLDAVSDVTGVADDSEGSTVRAVSYAGLTLDSRTLTLLGGCTVADSCESAAVDADDLSVQLHLLNGGVLNYRVTHADGHLRTVLASEMTAQRIIETFYMRVFSRLPSETELGFWTREFPSRDKAAAFKAVAEDFVWSLLTSEEFAMNH